MSKVKYNVMNGLSSLGLIWEGENGSLIYVPQVVTVDMNHDIDIYSFTTQEIVSHIDLRDLILNAIQPKDENKINVTININEVNNAAKFIENLKHYVKKASE